MEGIDAVLKKAYGIHVPPTLTEAEWLRLYAEYRMLRKTELQEIEIATQNALAKVINQFFAKQDHGFDPFTTDTATD